MYYRIGVCFGVDLVQKNIRYIAYFAHKVIVMDIGGLT